MKTPIVVLGVIFGLATGSVHANDAEALKRLDIRACEAQTQVKTNQEGEQEQKPCECEIENTDYEALAEAKKNGDLAKIQEINEEAKEACAE
ncbi:hypothetical protein [Kangiella spongicola]|jgi:uncharacterized membrane protein (DUF106 family)|uniref:Secreted protein n=1 Tax=Kangiella spongicola TaxID=796379 RepID=A0A318D5G4_9GAMM|nr:hypothetical protein [Kangiella spongicola]MBV34872.1 hypothetical protein [Rickettsiales bacterium]PXF64103.1 hypothetical protein DL796_02900 [Kangiella spongicola]